MCDQAPRFDCRAAIRRHNICGVLVLADAETSVLNLGLGLDLGGSLALSWSGRNSGRPVRDQADAEADSDRATENDHADGAAGRAALPS